jgi:hypothetical protein
MLEKISLHEQMCATSPQIRTEPGNSVFNQNSSTEQGLNLGAKGRSGNQVCPHHKKN